MSLMIKEHLTLTADKYCQENGIKKSSLAKIVLNDSSFFTRLDAGAGCSINTYEKFMGHFGRSIKIDPKTSDLIIS